MGENFDKSKLDDVAQMIQRYEHLSDMAYILAVPPRAPGSAPRLQETVNGIRLAIVYFNRSGSAKFTRSWRNTRSLATPTAQTIGRSSISMCSS